MRETENNLKGADFVNKFFKVIGGALSVLALGGGLYINSQQDALIRNALNTVEEKAAENFGTRIKIGNVEINSLNLSKLEKSSVTIHDIEIFDKNSERMAKVDTAKIKLKVLSLYNDGAGAIDEINITGAHVNIKKRDDDNWNVQDIKIKSEGESNFGALITVEDSDLNAEFDDKKIFIENISGSADCANMSAIDTKVSAKIFDSNISANGFLSVENQTVHANIDKVDVENILPFLPELPVEIERGTLSNAKIHVNRADNNFDLLGSMDVADGAITVENTQVENINGSTTFSKSEVCFNASATANGQAANASGIVHIDTDENVFDIHADSDNFAPSAVIENIGIDGAAKITAHMTGTIKNPTVDAEIETDYIGYENLSARNLKTNLRYAHDIVKLTNLSAETFGGYVEGNAEIQTADLSYNAHVKAYGLNLNSIPYDLPAYGNISGDVIVTGTGGDTDKLKVFGSAQADNINYDGFGINKAVSSFYLDGKNLKIDNLKAELPGRGAIGLEGSLIDNKVDFNFYGAHIDMATAKIFDSSLDMSGLTDFVGEIHGNTDNPQIILNLSAVGDDRSKYFAGKLFKQPFDSIKLSASGNFDGVNVDKFELEKGGKITWTVKRGVVGFTGDRNIDVELETARARVEDIVALVAPDQPLTGNINNFVKITGTLNNPLVEGIVDFKYGSYHGFLVSGMKGKYFVDDDKIRLQDFEITSPMADMVLNGTIDRKTQALDFVAQGSDLSLKRIENKFPYPVSGHGKFEGLITGTVDNPIFNGSLNAENLNFNGVNISDVQGHITVNGDNIVVDDVKFKQGAGNYNLFLAGNTATENFNGNIDVENVDIPELFLLAGQQAKLLGGKLNSKITVGGSADNPRITLVGDISQGEIVGYDLHDVNIELNYLNNILYVNKLEGKQGDKGEFNLSGTGGFNTPLDLKLKSRSLSLGIFSRLASLDIEVAGVADLDAKIGGTFFNPEAEATLSAQGTAGGATFDSITSHVTFKDWVCDIKDFTILRLIGGQAVSAKMSGKLPVVAFYLDPGDNIKPEEQLDLTVSLDGADLSLLPVLNKNISWAIGETGGKLRIMGTAKSPLIYGAIGVNDGTIKFKHVDSMIENINIAMMFQGSRFDIASFVGNVGDGTINLEGGFNYENLNFSNYNFNLKADALDIKSAVFTGPINAEFTLNEGKTPHGRILPKITGHLDLDHCTIGLPTIPESDEPLPDMLLDVSVNLGEKVHLYSSRLFDMFLTGSANFEGSTLFPKPSGLITVRRGGTVTYLQTVFDVKEGEAHFNQIGSFFPNLKFRAETKLTRTTITLGVEGTLDNMQLKLQSNPSMTETEIMQALTFREAYDRGDNNVGLADALSIGLQMSIIGEIEDTIKRNLGLDRFILTSGSGSAFDRHSHEEESKGNEFNLSIGKYVTDKIMLRYTQGINGKRISRIGVLYDINKNIGITAEHESGEFIFGFEAKFDF